jgi:hypothetical protein
MKLWKVVDGVPYMVNDPRLGILALNPKGEKSMARRHGARHMAWVRSFRKNPKRHHRRHKRNPAGPVAAAMYNPRRRHYYKRNPSKRMRGLALKARGMLGMPPLMPIVYGAAGFVTTAFVNSTIFGFLPTTITTSAAGTPSPIVKYAVILGSIIVTTWAAKSFLGPGAAAFAGVGGGIFLVSQAAHDFAPGVVPGMGAGPGLNIGSYANVRSYSKIRGMHAAVPAAPGHPLQIGAPAWGSQNTTDFAEFGGTEVVASRFRRFQ